MFDSSGGFLLPDGSVRSPDASLVRLERWQALGAEERRGFPPLCPDLVVELASPSDRPTDLERRGRRCRGGNGSGRISEAMGLDADPVFPGLAIDLKEVWAA